MTIIELRKEIYNWRFTKKRAVDLSVGISALLLLEFVGRPIYRTYIYANEIYDFHIADTLGNTLGTIATVFFFLAVIGREKKLDYFIINAVTIGVVLDELIHPLRGKPIDPWDIVATVLTGGVCYVIYYFLHSSKKETKSA